MKRLYKLTDQVITLGGIVAGFLIVITTGMVFYEVISRGFFDAPTIWSTELSIYAIIGSCFLGSAYAVRESAHIRVDLLINAIPKRFQNYLSFVANSLGLLFSIIFTWYSWEHVHGTMTLGFTSTSLLRVPMYIPEMLLPIGGVLLCLSFILQLADDLHNEGGKTK